MPLRVEAVHRVEGCAWSCLAPLAAPRSTPGPRKEILPSKGKILPGLRGTRGVTATCHYHAYKCGNSSLERIKGFSASALLALRSMAGFRVFSLLSVCCLAMWRDKKIPVFLLQTGIRFPEPLQACAALAWDLLGQML